jgi:hypothetical protein
MAVGIDDAVCRLFPPLSLRDFARRRFDSRKNRRVTRQPIRIAVLHDPKSSMGSFMKVAHEFDDVTPVGIESPLWPKTGTGSGWMEPQPLNALGVDIADFKLFAIKSRVHFRRGFDDSGFARTILLVEPSEPFLGTTRLNALPYQNVDLKDFYPYGEPRFP